MKRKIEGPVNVDPEFAIGQDDLAKIDRMIDEAEEDITQQERIHIRWSRPQLEVVRRAAQVHGMSLGTYVKMAAFRQAVQDLKDQSVLAGVAPVAAGRPVMVLVGVGPALQPLEGAEYYRV